jgi:predicted peptidase
MQYVKGMKAGWLPAVLLCFAFLQAIMPAAGQERRRLPTKRAVEAAKKNRITEYKGNIDSLYSSHEWVNAKGDTLRYRLLLPPGYDASKKWPLVLFLHGAGERGSDNAKQLVHGAKLFAAYRDTFPAVVVFPQCPATDFWANVKIEQQLQPDSTYKRQFIFQEGGEPGKAMGLLLEWLPQLEKDYAINPAQRYVMGLSMGGMGTFEIVRRMKNYFAAAVPICGGANPATAAQIKDTPFWVFHGREDSVVPYELSEKMVAAMLAYMVHAEINLILYDGVNHNSWDNAFAEPQLLPWLFAQKKKTK